jgi:pyruvate dehydrogenase E1 component beta subunit
VSVVAAPPRNIRYVGAIVEALEHCLADDERVFLAGEDIGAYGGVFRHGRGLQERFGERRVIDMPISEAAIMGLGVGAAATGLRPVIELMFMDFVAICLDQIVNQMAKARYMFGGKMSLPVTVLTFAGAGGSMAAQHSQSLEAWLCHVPGLKVVMPSGPYEAKGLLTAAIHDDDPVIVIMNKVALGVVAPVPEEPYELPIGRAEVVRAGSDLTIVASGNMVRESLTAAHDLESRDGLSVEVVDLRTLQPLDTDTILTSVAKTHRCLVVHEAVRFGGFGAEIAAQVQELGFDELDAPVHRVGAPFAPVPFSAALEREYIPDAARIVGEADRLFGLRP